MPVPERTDEDAPEDTNVYSDGSLLNPRVQHYAVGGAGIWHPGRTGTADESEIERRFATRQSWADGTEMFAAVKGDGLSSTRTELAAAIIAIAATGSREIVKGMSKAIAIGELKPGNAPTKTPINTPDKIKRIF